MQKRTVRRERNLADYGYPIPDTAALSAKALEVTKRLTDLYGEVPFSSKDPMSMLVDIILSHRTRDEQTAAAYDNLLKRFGSWEAVRDAPTNEVQDTIANVNWPEVKAPRLQALLPNNARAIYNFHKALLRHGQRVCVYERPRCSKCVLTDMCDYYKTVVKPQLT